MARDSECECNFCDKQQIVEVCKKNQGYYCYSYASRRDDIVLDPSLEIQYTSLSEDLIFESYSLVKFSLLYQVLVYNAQFYQVTLN